MNSTLWYLSNNWNWYLPYHWYLPNKWYLLNKVTYFNPLIMNTTLWYLPDRITYFNLRYRRKLRIGNDEKVNQEDYL